MTARRVTLLLALSAACGACVVAPATALAGTLDQQQTASNFNEAVVDVQSVAQTFTAGRSGRLDQVDLFLRKFGSPAAGIAVELRDVAAGAPGTQVLATTTVPASSVTGLSVLGFASAGFSAPASVAAGTQYAIVAYTSASGASAYGWGAQSGNPYPGGSEFTLSASPPGSSWAQHSNDTAFKTYVAPTSSGPTGQRSAALKKCKKKHSHKARKKCKKKANLLPL